jgi:hypothetical protein
LIIDRFIDRIKLKLKWFLVDYKLNKVGK